MFLDDIATRHLGVFHQGVAAVAIDIDRHISLVEPRHSPSAQESVGQLLALNAGVIARTIARLVNLVKIGRTEKLVVVVKLPFVMTEIAGGRVEFLMIWTAGETALHVVDYAGVIDECAIVPFVAQIGQAGPTIHVGLSYP